jgi:hypothetical protein
MIREEDMRKLAGAVELDAGAEAEAGRLLTAALETAPVRPGLAAEWGTALTPGTAAAPASDPLGRVRKRAARQRRARVLVPAGAVALAAAVAGGVTAGVITGGGGTASPNALATLTAALVKTSAQSFTFTASASFRPGLESSQSSATGEFDPVSRTGTEQVRSDEDTWQIRYVGAHAYSTTAKFPAGLTHGKPWVEALVPPDDAVVSRDQVTALGEDLPINPANLLAQLKSATTVRVAGPASGSGWRGTKYTFTLTVGPSQYAVTASGTVSVDSAGRVRQLVIKDPSEFFLIEPGKKQAIAFAQTLTFGGFGTPVRVTAPPADQVFNAGDKYLYVVPGDIRPGLVLLGR